MTPIMFLAAALAAPPDADRFRRWEPEVAALEKRLVAARPAAGGVVFAGSSTIRLWDVAGAFPGRAVANVGFGGAEVRDCTHFAPRLIAPLKPPVVVFYAGDNDLADGRTPDQVRTDFLGFVATVRRDVPAARVLFVAVKPSPARWHLYAAQATANEMVKADSRLDPEGIGYIDAVPALLGPDGKPDPTLFVADGLHLSPAGYKRWAAVIGPAVWGR